MYRKRIAVDLAKDGFQVTEAERSGAVKKGLFAACRRSPYMNC